MSKRIIFGGPSEVFPEEYPTHPPLVSHDYGEHSTHNPDYHHYAGLGDGVAYAQEMPASAQRELVRQANLEMAGAFKCDGIGRDKQPGAMGSYWAEGSLEQDTNSDGEDEGGTSADYDEDADDRIRRGHQIYLGSSMKQKRRGDYEVALESSLHDQLAGDDDNLPNHRMNFQCAEPGLISEYRYKNPPSDDDHGEADNNDDEAEEEPDGPSTWERPLLRPAPKRQIPATLWP